jgi:hypothetical protein
VGLDQRLLTADPSLVGTGQIGALPSGTSPMFANPVATDRLGLDVLRAWSRGHDRAVKSRRCWRAEEGCGQAPGAAQRQEVERG